MYQTDDPILKGPLNAAFFSLNVKEGASVSFCATKGLFTLCSNNAKHLELWVKYCEIFGHERCSVGDVNKQRFTFSITHQDALCVLLRSKNKSNQIAMLTYEPSIEYIQVY